MEPIGIIAYVEEVEILYYDAEAFLDCIRVELPYRDSTGFHYKVLTNDPSIRKRVDDILLDFFGEENPRTVSEYAQEIGGF